MTSTIAQQFDTATIDFYSSLAEQNLELAAEVGCVMRTMKEDNVLNQVQKEMVQDCLNKLGKAGFSQLQQHCKPVVNLHGLATVAKVCAVAGTPHD
jgi:hypothetical protein